MLMDRKNNFFLILIFSGKKYDNHYCVSIEIKK